MPKGNPGRQTVASAKYNEKVGWLSKTYKIKKDVAEAFKEACDKKGVSQASVLMEFMREFADSTLPE